MRAFLIVMVALAPVAEAVRINNHHSEIELSEPLWEKYDVANITAEDLVERCSERGLQRDGELGSGAQGIVYLVKNHEGKHMALKEVKVYPPGHRARRGFSRGRKAVRAESFASEVAKQEKAFRIGLALPVLDAWICPQDTLPWKGYFLMPVLQGRPLYEVINENRTFAGVPLTVDDEPTRCAQKYFFPARSTDGSIGKGDYEQAANAIIKLNEAKLMQMDFHPSNAFVNPDGRLIFLDFGMVSDEGMPCCVPEWALQVRLGCHRWSKDRRKVLSEVLFQDDIACPDDALGC